MTEVTKDSPKKGSLAALAAAATTTLAVVSFSGNSNNNSSSNYINNNNSNKTSNGCGPNTVAQNSLGKANTIVGSISIETPPPHIQLELKQQQQLQQQLLQLQQQQQQQSMQQQQQQQTTLNPIKIVGSTIKDSPVKKLELININKPNLTNLPILSISGPSPPADSNKDFL